MTHDQLQSKCVIWLWNEFYFERGMWHHNKANSINQVQGARDKALGVARGIWDLEYVTPNGMIAWFEFKVGKDKLSDSQRQFRAKINQRCTNHIWFEIRTFEDFKDIICQITGKSL